MSSSPLLSDTTCWHHLLLPYCLTPLVDTTCCCHTVWHHLLTPLVGTTCWHHLLTPLVGITCWHNLLTPLVDTTCWHHLLTPLVGITCWHHLLASLVDNMCTCEHIIVSYAFSMVFKLIISFTAKHELKFAVKWKGVEGGGCGCSLLLTCGFVTIFKTPVSALIWLRNRWILIYFFKFFIFFVYSFMCECNRCFSLIFTCFLEPITVTKNLIIK